MAANLAFGMTEAAPAAPIAIKNCRRESSDAIVSACPEALPSQFAAKASLRDLVQGPDPGHSLRVLTNSLVNRLPWVRRDHIRIDSQGQAQSVEHRKAAICRYLGHYLGPRGVRGQILQWHCLTRNIRRIYLKLAFEDQLRGCNPGKVD